MLTDALPVYLLAGLLLMALLWLLFARGRDRRQQRALELQHQQLQQDHIAVQTELRLAREQFDAGVAEYQRQLAGREQRIAELLATETALRTGQATLQSRFESNEKAHAEKLQLLTDAKQQLTREFETLAAKIFDEKQERFTKQSKEHIDLTLNPLREQLTEFRKRVEDVYERETRDRMSLRTELGHLKELNQRMSEEALNLTRALKGETKTQGNWGEIVLERVILTHIIYHEILDYIIPHALFVIEPEIHFRSLSI